MVSHCKCTFQARNFKFDNCLKDNFNIGRQLIGCQADNINLQEAFIHLTTKFVTITTFTPHDYDNTSSYKMTTLVFKRIQQMKFQYDLK